LIQNRLRNNILLYPISILYSFGVDFRHFLYDIGVFKRYSYRLPIICVGNLNVGGTGKTPMVEYLINFLKENFNISIISRGYKRESKGFREVFLYNKVEEVGDEPLQIKNKFPDIQVIVCEKRRYAIERVINNKKDKPQIIIMDDGFQHLEVKPNINIIMIDYRNPIYKDFPLPFGTLREKIKYLIDSHIIVVNNAPKDLKPLERRFFISRLNLYNYHKCYFSHIKYKKPIPLFPEYTNVLKYNFTKMKYNILLVTGIANPTNLINYIKEFSEEIIPLIYPDHHYFSHKDFETIYEKFNSFIEPNKIIITTEKDAIRIKNSKFVGLIKNLPLFYIPIELEIGFDEEEDFKNQILDYVRKNLSYNRLY